MTSLSPPGNKGRLAGNDGLVEAKIRVKSAF